MEECTFLGGKGAGRLCVCECTHLGQGRQAGVVGQGGQVRQYVSGAGDWAHIRHVSG